MRRAWALAVISGSLLGVLVGGCPAANSQSLTDKENLSVRAVRVSASAITQSLGVLQTVAGDGSVRIALSGLRRPTAAGADIVFGACPVVTLSGNTGTSFTLDVAFPSKCAPLGNTDYLCSGAAGGTFNALAQTVDIAFQTMNCNDKSLNGSALVEYTLSSEDVVLTGAWTLQFMEGADTLATDGAGTSSYSKADNTTTIDSFAGSVTLDGESYSVILSQMQISYQNNANLIPFAGSAAITSDSIRDITVYFDENSPATGVVKVRIGTSEPFEVNLNNL